MPAVVKFGRCFPRPIGQFGTLLNINQQLFHFELKSAII